MKKIICTFLMTTLFIQISFSTTYAANSQNDESACTDLLGYCLDTVLQDPEPITSIMSTDGLNLVQFLYDSNGQRISKSYMGQVTYYFYNENGELVKEEENGNTIDYFYEDIEGVSVVSGFRYNGNMYFYQYDQGSIKFILNEDYEKICQYDYGNNEPICITYDDVSESPQDSKDSIGNINPFRYNGMYYDIETNCYYTGNGIYYDANRNIFIKNDYTLNEGALNNIELFSAGPSGILARDVMEMTEGYLNDPNYGAYIAAVSRNEWNSGKRWYDSLSVEEIAARCIYAENFGETTAAYADRIAISRVIANRANKDYLADSPTIYGVLTAKSQFSTVNPGTWNADLCLNSRALKTGGPVWKHATILGCMLTLTSSTTEMEELVTWPKGIDNQLHFYGLDSVYTSDAFTIKNGVLYQNATALTNVAVAGEGKLNVSSATDKKSLLNRY